MPLARGLKDWTRERIWKIGNEGFSRHRNNGSKKSEMFLEKISMVDKNMGLSEPSRTVFKSQCCCAVDVWPWASHLQTRNLNFFHCRMGMLIIVLVLEVLLWGSNDIMHAKLLGKNRVQTHNKFSKMQWTLALDVIWSTNCQWSSPNFLWEPLPWCVYDCGLLTSGGASKISQG